MRVNRIAPAACIVMMLMLVVPGIASATSLARNGNPLVVGSSFKMTSNLMTLATEAGWGTFECATAEIAAELTENGPHVEAEALEAGRAERCTREGDYSIQISELEMSNLRLTSMESGTMDLDFDVDTFSCHVKGAEVPVIYVPGSSSITVYGLLEAGACGHMYLYSTFTLTSGDGEDLIIN